MSEVQYKFQNRMEMMAFLKTLKPKDHFRITKEHGMKPANKEEANLLTDYLVQGINNGLSGETLTKYAVDRTARLVAIMPHLAAPKDPVVVDASAEPETETVQNTVVQESQNPTETVVIKTQSKPVKVKAEKRPRTVSKVKHPDGTIVARPDRGGFEGWYAGKAEAFRPTVEKVQQFLQKKYNLTGQLLT